MKSYLLFFISLFFLSCSDDRLTGSQLWEKAYQYDNSIELVMIPDTQPHKRVLCESYGQGCVLGSGIRVKVDILELIVVEFDTESNAKAEAFKIGEYYYKNFLFDNVNGEPILERFVKNAVGAKKGTK